MNKWKGCRFRAPDRVTDSQPQVIRTVLFWSLQTEDRFVSLPDQWLTLPWHSLAHLSSRLWFHCWSRMEGCLLVNARAQQFRLSSISVGFSISSLLFFVKMSQYCSLSIKALLVNPIVSFEFVQDLDYCIDLACLLQTQHARHHDSSLCGLATMPDFS